MATAYPWKLHAVKHAQQVCEWLMSHGHMPLDVQHMVIHVTPWTQHVYRQFSEITSGNTCFSPAWSYVHSICKLTIQNYFLNWLWLMRPRLWAFWTLSQAQACWKPESSPASGLALEGLAGPSSGLWAWPNTSLTKFHVLNCSRVGMSSFSLRSANSWRYKCPIVGAIPLTNFSAPRCTECSIQLQNKLSNVSLQNNKRQTECDAWLGPITAYKDQSPHQHISYKNHCLGHCWPWIGCSTGHTIPTTCDTAPVTGTGYVGAGLTCGFGSNTMVCRHCGELLTP